jgi:nitroreductase
MRHLRPDPVPDDVVHALIEAATCAPSPGNSQGWDFIVVTEAERRHSLATILRDGVSPLLPLPSRDGDPARRRLLESAHHLLDHALEVPLWILVCGRPVYPASAPSADWIGAAVYPAAQNLLLAARALGLGATFSAWHMPSERAVRDLLQIPDDAKIAVTVPVGWPAKAFGPVRRKPVSEVTHWNGW